jgi:hypothetical protein
MDVNGGFEFIGSGVLVAEEGLALHSASGVVSLKSGAAEIYYNPGDDRWYISQNSVQQDEIARKSDIPAAVSAPTTSGYTTTMTTTTAVITHGMGTRFVQISLVDTGNDQVTLPKRITIDSATQVTIQVQKARNYEVTVIGVI